ncbi:substrate-binding periplasmic protein [Niveispirillum fermenti]|uniref:substrate-binding periplasmic protein n=1 Tax=Niveispirillum fermenti TaxID=1233113 RepID=UPI003A8A0542
MACVWLLTAFSVLVPAAAAGDVLRLLMSESLPPPYLIQLEGEAEPTGLTVDLCRKVAARLGYGASVRVAPPKRVPELMRAGEADMLCHVSPNWYPYPEEMWFGRRLYSADNVFIAARDAEPVCEECAIPREVATVIGSDYGERVDMAFASGRSARRDVRSEENVFRLIQYGRMAYGIVPEYTFHYFAGHNQDMAIKGHAYRFNITVGVPRSGPIGEAELLIATASIRLPQDVDPAFRPYLGLPGIEP